MDVKAAFRLFTPATLACGLVIFMTVYVLRQLM